MNSVETPQAAAPRSLGISGRLARVFLQSPLTPLIALVALLAGIFAVLITPKEEEPQINVTMANVLIPFPGATAKEVESLVTVPAEQILSQIAGIEHVYSMTQPGMAVLTVQYKVGEDRIAALVKLYDVLNSNSDWLPQYAGVGQFVVKPKGIDDVPVLTLTLSTKEGCTLYAKRRVPIYADEHQRPRQVIDAMSANGSTNQTIGLAWGWHSLTQGAPLTPPALPANTQRIIIILSDGLNTQNRWNGNGSNQSTAVDARTEKACVNVKSQKSSGCTSLGWMQTKPQLLRVFNSANSQPSLLKVIQIAVTLLHVLLWNWSPAKI